jgi:hypothetical protein
MELKPIKGYMGGPKAKVNSDIFDDMGMDDGGLFVITVANERNKK